MVVLFFSIEKMAWDGPEMAKEVLFPAILLGVIILVGLLVCFVWACRCLLHGASLFHRLLQRCSRKNARGLHGW